MSQYFIENETQKVNFPDGQWIDIKKELSQKDADDITNRMMVTEDNERRFKLGKQATLEVCIVAWSFNVPVTPGNISNLKTKYRIGILAEIDKLNAESIDFSKNL